MRNRERESMFVTFGATSGAVAVCARCAFPPSHLSSLFPIPHSRFSDTWSLLCLVNLVSQMDRKAMVGVLSMKDVVKVLLEDQKHEIDSLKEYVHGSY